MCLHPKTLKNVNNDLLDRPIVHSNYCTFADNCDYVSVDNQMLIENTDLAVLQLNIRGLINKLDKLNNLLNKSFSNKRPDILILCETWLSKSSPNVSIPGYYKYKSRRMHKKGGGVSIYVIDNLQSRERPDLKISEAMFEHCIVEIKLKERKLLVGSLYRVPNTNQVGFLNDYKEVVHKLKNTNSSMILGMDHNLNFLKSHLHENTRKFINYNLDNDLFPVITRLTRITHNTATLIDNIFLESGLTGQMTSKILIDDISDHLPCVSIIGNLLPSEAMKRTITSRDIRPKCLESLRNDLANSIPSLEENLDINSQFLGFHTLLQSKLKHTVQ